MNRNIIPDKCICGNSAKIIGYYIKGVANHKNYFVKCNNCKTRTRSRKTPYKAVEEWNEYRGDLFLQQRKINVGIDMKEDIDIKWLEEYAEQEKKYKWGKEIKKLIKRNKELEEERDNLIIQKNADYYKISKLKDDLDEVEGDKDYNYIPKSKIREKIEEIIQNSSRFNCLSEVNMNDEYNATRFAVTKLQELLEGRN